MISRDFDDVIQGKLNTKATIPAFFTPQKCLEINKKLNDAALSATRKEFQEASQPFYTNQEILTKMKNVDISGAR